MEESVLLPILPGLGRGYCMEERQQALNHTLVLKNRNFIQLTGVTDVNSFDDGEIILETDCGMLMIKGSELHISHLILEKGEVNVDGRVDSLTYSESHKSAKQAKNLVGRLFK